jgi:hypothetical protein
MSATIRDTRQRIAEALASSPGDGRTAAYGASVGCVALISQFGLGKDLACIFDDQPLLDAVLGPDYAVPVVAPGEIYSRLPALIVVLAWRYADIIMRKHRDFHEAGGRFLLPLPQVTLQ